VVGSSFIRSLQHRYAYDAWFRSKVQEALDDPRPATPQAQVMQDAQALIDEKRRARS